MRCLICDRSFQKEHHHGWYNDSYWDFCPECGDWSNLIPVIAQHCKVSKKEARDTLDLIMGVRNENKL